MMSQPPHLEQLSESLFIQQLQHPLVRDLAWSLLSPPLLTCLPDNYGHIRMQEFNSAQKSQLRSWLLTLEQNPDALLAWTAAQPTQRIGQFFESLWRFYLDQRHHLLVSGLQINHNHKTLGELDAVYLDHDQQLTHAELAVKFYLGHLSLNAAEVVSLEWQHWQGPNTLDRLDLKLQHMLDHQLPLGQRALDNGDLQSATAMQLPSAASLTSELILRGRFFLPWQASPSYQPPQYSHPDLDYGIWCHRQSLPQLLDTKPGWEWLLLKRNQWLAPVQATANTQLTPPQLLQQASEMDTTRPLLLAGGRRDGQLWQEQCRLFVVNDDWPQSSPTADLTRPQ